MNKIILVLTTLSAIAFSLSLISCAGATSTEADTLSPTIYYKPTVDADSEKCNRDEKVKMQNSEGETLADLCPQDYNACLMQGSCFVRIQGRQHSFNVAAKNSHGYSFVEVDVTRCPYGYGVKNSCLDPYFSVAADLKYYNVGDVIYIPRLVGAVLPNGEVHDGFLIVRDQGEGVQGPQRFDFFTGFYNHRAKENTLASLGFGERNNRFEFRKATEVEAEQVREHRGYPGLNSERGE